MNCPRCGELLADCPHGWLHCPCDTAPALSLTVTDTARYLYVSRATIYRWITGGLLPGLRQHGRIRIPLVSIKAYLAAETLAMRQARAARGGDAA